MAGARPGNRGARGGRREAHGRRRRRRPLPAHLCGPCRGRDTGSRQASRLSRRPSCRCFAEANVSIRLAPGQDAEQIAYAFERLLRDAAPEGAELEIERRSTGPPGLIPPDAAAVRLAQDAFERVFGRRPLLLRSGGSIPLVPALADRGIPTVLTGFALPDANMHSPNERLLVRYVPLGVEAARETLVALGGLR